MCIFFLKVFFLRNCIGDPIESSTDRNVVSQTSSSTTIDGTSISSSSSSNSRSSNSISQSSTLSLLSSSLSSLSPSLLSSSTKSYVPVTTAPKVSKRAGTLAEAKLKVKLIK